MVRAQSLRWEAATAERWQDVEQLFGPRGACGGCWCMAWRLPAKEFRARAGEANKRALKKLTKAEIPPGVLLYKNDEAVGWCAVAPREQYVRLENSKVWAPVDKEPVWSVSCFFVKRGHRNQGLTIELLKAAVEFAKQHGAKIVEGYANDINGRLPDAFVWTGLIGTYKKVGFQEVVRRSEKKPILRKVLRTGIK